MGQPITVGARAGAHPETMLFDLDRSLTGMAIERYADADAAAGTRPPDVLARRLFDLGATGVTIYSNVVTVEAPADRWSALEPQATHTIAHLFEYYGDDAGWSPEALGTGASGDATGEDAGTEPVSEPATTAPA